MTVWHWLHLCFQSPWGWVLSACWGVLWGSFATVCVTRIPQQRSIVRPGSQCPQCHIPLRWYDNVPLLSFVWLRGRCRRCQQPISWQYPLIELLVSVWHVLVFARFLLPHFSPMALLAFLIYGFFGTTLLVLAFIDARHHILPNAITYPAIPICFVFGRLLPHVSWQHALVGALGGYVVIRLIADLYRWRTGRDGLGYGDGKLLALVGALLGFQAVVTSLLLGSLSGLAGVLLWTLVQRIRGTQTGSLRHTVIPFGPFLCVGAAVHLLLLTGHSLADLFGN